MTKQIPNIHSYKKKYNQQLSLPNNIFYTRRSYTKEASDTKKSKESSSITHSFNSDVHAYHNEFNNQTN